MKKMKNFGTIEDVVKSINDESKFELIGDEINELEYLANETRKIGNAFEIVGNEAMSERLISKAYGIEMACRKLKKIISEIEKEQKR